MIKGKTIHVFELLTEYGWLTSHDGDWQKIIYTPTGSEQKVGKRTIDGESYQVWKCQDNKFRAIKL